MFTVEQIQQAHQKVKSGADFPKYIQDLKQLGVKSYKTFVNDSHTEYLGTNDYQANSAPKYEKLMISDMVNRDVLVVQLKAHQQGKTDYFNFCKDCANNGINYWMVSIDEMTCTYYDKKGNNILTENIPT
ncbi:DUF1398 domain-containing protein [Pedobacter aquatilis]|uniref:DUF1398 domain-containing protein n=1 Tax=Pedobacter aquatilis TaxID=351343 RepID=UPI0029310EDE|nr:DUF1398 family protein [Pedobacter aquatilis]